MPLLKVCLEHIRKMLFDAKPPDMPPEAQDMPELRVVHDYCFELRRILRDFSTGNLSEDICLRGSLAGSLKALQANLLHLTWQIQQVAGGDFTYRVDFMGEFSDAFNSMVVQLDSALSALRRSEDELLRLTEALQQEIELKNQAMSALRQSEASFKYEAEHDALTGVLNRRAFYEYAEAMLNRAQLSGQYCGLAIFDIDSFKPFNDTFGHLNGDLALSHVTSLAKATVRTGDSIGRFGGDEFVLFLSFSEEKAGKSIVERLRKAVAFSPVVTMEGERIALTISLGFICVPPDFQQARDADFLEELIHFADEALYRAKRGGRNKVSMRTLSNKQGMAKKSGAAGKKEKGAIAQ